ncbi:MAG: hypothetical protein KFW21_07060 [Spirochaetota bacterium]|nr:hypothetical protein [Spirochaetota bacterium]
MYKFFFQKERTKKVVFYYKFNSGNKIILNRFSIENFAKLIKFNSLYLSTTNIKLFVFCIESADSFQDLLKSDLFNNRINKEIHKDYFKLITQFYRQNGVIEWD